MPKAKSSASGPRPAPATAGRPMAKSSASPPPTGARKKRPVGRERMNLMVDRTVLERAAAHAGSTNMSDVVDTALRRMAEDDAIVAGLDALLGAIPDFPDMDT